MSFRNFAKRALRLKNKPFSFSGRPYLDEIYASRKARLVLRCSRQVEKSTFLVNKIIYDAIRMPGRQILVVCPRQDQGQMFSTTRLKPAIEQSPAARRLLWPYKRPMPVFKIEFRNGSSVFVRAAFRSADPARGISADELVIDEYQDMAHNSLDILNETLSHSPQPSIILAGTPKWSDNAIESAFRRSTACEWHVNCPGCHNSMLLGEQTIGLEHLICPHCQHPLDPQQGEWLARNPDSTWGDGFTINHLMVPWLTVAKVRERQQNYDRVQFVNEVLGIPALLGDHIVTREEMEACCEDRPFAQSIDDIPPASRRQLVLGLDWGGGSVSGTVAVIGHALDERRFSVSRFNRWLPNEDPDRVLEEVVTLCRQFRIQWIAADDNGGGSVYNRLLFKRLLQEGLQARFYGIFYAAETSGFVPQGVVTRWTIGRTSTIGGLFTRIKAKLISFPRVSESGSFLDEFTCEVKEFDDAMRVSRYTKPDDTRDDALHATNYAEMLAMRISARPR